MQMKLTSKDKMLLSLMAFVLIAVVFIYYLIMPAMTRMDDLDLEIEDAQMQQQEMQMKISMRAGYEQSFKELQQAAADETAQYYDLMTSQEVDREITGIVLAHGLESVGLNIQPAAYTIADPYSRSELARAEELEEAAAAAAAAAASEENDGTVTDAINEGMQNQRDAYQAAAAAYEGDSHPVRVDVQDQIYTCKVSLSVEGEEENYQQLIDTLVNGYPAIRVTGISYQDGLSRMMVLPDGSTELQEGRRQLVLNMDMYMCDKSLYEQVEATGGSSGDALSQLLNTAGDLLAATQQTDAQ